MTSSYFFSCVFLKKNWGAGEVGGNTQHLERNLSLFFGPNYIGRKTPVIYCISNSFDPDQASLWPVLFDTINIFFSCLTSIFIKFKMKKKPNQ